MCSYKTTEESCNLDKLLLNRCFHTEIFVCCCFGSYNIRVEESIQDSGESLSVAEWHQLIVCKLQQTLLFGVNHVPCLAERKNLTVPVLFHNVCKIFKK